jgi:segregation and condensation protein B
VDADEAGAQQAPPPVRAVVEAILLVADEPVPVGVLAQVIERPAAEVEQLLRSLASTYTGRASGFELSEVGGGWRLFTRPDCAPYVERFVRDGRPATLSRAALETLAIIAYRQPITRARISAIRGVAVDAVVRTLLARGLIDEAGTEPVSGAVLHRTTAYFLERLGVAALDELPPLADFLSDQTIDLVDDASA